MPKVFHRQRHPPFPYLKRAREVMRSFCLNFLGSNFDIITVKGIEVVNMLVPGTKEELQELFKKLERLHFKKHP